MTSAPLIPDLIIHGYFAPVLVGILLACGMGLEKLRTSYRRPARGRKMKTVSFERFRSRATHPRTETSFSAEAQLRIVSQSNFSSRRVLSEREARVRDAAEQAIGELGLPWRVMAQVSLGEILASDNADAYRAVNSKRVDLLIVSPEWKALAALEYQGSGHYQSTAAARDAVKREALRRAGVRFIEMTTEHSPRDLKNEISRLARAIELKAAA